MKTSGLGDDLFVGGFHIGGDIKDVQVHGGPALLDVTDITQSAHARLGGLRDGGMSLTSYHDPAPGAAHAVFAALPATDEIVTYLRGQAAGNPAACCNSKQIGYDPTRDNAGNLTFKVDAQASGFGVEWGEQLTAGLRTDTAAANGVTQDDGAGTSFGAQAYLHATALTGSAVTVTIQHSTDGAAWAALAAFAAVTAAPQTQRITVAGTVDRYVRAVTAGTFTSFAFQVTFMRNLTAVSF